MLAFAIKQSHSRVSIFITHIHIIRNEERDKLESYLIILLMHMLKVKYQSNMKTTSWELSIKNSRHRAKKVLKDNPSLKLKLNEIKKDAYYSARLEAAIETKLPEKTFPQKCPWDINEILI